MWGIITGWPVVAAVVPVIITIGIGVLSMNPPGPITARICFSVAAIILIMRVGYWLAFELSATIVQRCIFAFVIFGVIGTLWLLAMNWASEKKRDEAMDKKTLDINAPGGVISVNQQGGQTAKTIYNINAEQRRQIAPESINSHLNPFAGMKAYFHWRADDKESCLFRDSLAECLKSSGWDVILSVGHVADESVYNVIIEINGRQGANDMSESAASALGGILNANRIPNTIEKNQRNPLSSNSMYIRIGPIR